MSFTLAIIQTQPVFAKASSSKRDAVTKKASDSDEESSEEGGGDESASASEGSASQANTAEENADEGKTAASAKTGAVTAEDSEGAVPKDEEALRKDPKWAHLMDNPVIPAESRSARRFLAISDKRDDLERILRRSRFNKKELKAFFKSDVLPDDYRVVAQTAYHVTYYAHSDETDVKIYEPDGSRAVVFQKRGKKINVSLIPGDLETRIGKVAGEVHGTLINSIIHKTGDTRLAQRFMSAFLFQYPAEQLSQEGAHFSMTLERLFYQGEMVKYGEILSAKLEVNGVQEERHFVKFQRGGAFLDLAPNFESRVLYAPVDYVRVTSLFNPRRFHPFRRRYIAHKGVDMALPKGEPVYAAADGVVDAIGRNRAGGKFIRLVHANGIQSNYEHLSAYETGLHTGEHVKAGQRIARVGCTGFCTSPHLHFGVKVDGEVVDPLFYTNSYPFNHTDLVSAYIEKQADQRAPASLPKQ